MFLFSDKLSTLEGDKRKKKLESELAYLAKKEEEVDGWITSLETSMKSMTEEKRWAYLTHADIRTIPVYKDQTLLLVKAPPNTSLTVPPPEEVIAIIFVFATDVNHYLWSLGILSLNHASVLFMNDSDLIRIMCILKLAYTFVTLIHKGSENFLLAAIRDEKHRGV